MEQKARLSTASSLAGEHITADTQRMLVSIVWVIGRIRSFHVSINKRKGLTIF